VLRASRADAPLVVVAFSWGAIPTVIALADAPGLADGIVLVNPSPPTLESWIALYEYKEDRLDWEEALGQAPRGPRGEPICERISRQVAAQRRKDDAAPLEITCSERAYWGTVNAIHEFDLRSAFSDLKMPVLVIRGEHDPGAEVLKFEALSQPDLTVRRLEDCGHMVLADQHCQAQLEDAVSQWFDNEWPSPRSSTR